MNKYILSFGMLLLASPLVAQDKMISKADLMANKLPENFRSPMPTFMKWLDDDRVIFNQKIHPDSTAKNYVMEVKSGKLTLATPDQMKGAAPPTKTVSVKKSDLFYKNGNDEKQITFDAAEEKNPTFSPDSTYIAYTKSNDLYTYNLLTNKETRLTFRELVLL